jgi:hypothetical protein
VENGIEGIYLERRYWMRYIRGEDVFHRDIGSYISGVSQEI